ncbi:MAG TPA: aminotransferase class I/II-fold pyridoxal phosphate-dependent enzyme [Noviherbaspirillum sp.]
MEISNRIRLARPLPTVALHGRAEQLKARGEPVVDLAIALSNHPTPKAVAERIEQGLRATEPMPYTEVSGSARLRRVLVEKLQRENRLEVRPEEIIVTNGAKQAVYEALYVLTDPGDSVIVFRPYWPANLAIPELLGLNVILVDLPEQFTAAALAALPPAKAVILNNPHNPVGKVFTQQELHCLKDWIASRKMLAIVDESYEHLIFEGEHTSLAALCEWRELNVVTVFSASQSYGMMGWRVGFAVAPKQIIAAMETLQGPITAAASALTQLAAEGAFSSGARSEMLEDYRGRRDRAMRRLSEIPWMKIRSPHSGPYLWGDVSALTMDTLAFAEAMLEQEKVAVMPGEALGVQGHIRLSFISDTEETLCEGMARIIRFGDNFASRR